jgi:hypothetical protein
MDEALQQLLALLSKLEINVPAAQAVGVNAFPLRLPTGQTTTSIALVMPMGKTGDTLAFMLPSSAQFTAKTSLGERQTFDAKLIHGGKLEFDQGDPLQTGAIFTTSSSYLQSIRKHSHLASSIYFRRLLSL